ncbi:MAG: hypothetical protein HYR97_07925, partial [Candidatus Melainabacteria bacterium]|nr:hypothetical protein [Candidatus Melainabacteria bacterium]
MQVKVKLCYYLTKKKKKKIKPINSLSDVPTFNSEEEEREFWETHDLSNELTEKLYNPKVNKDFS